MKVTCIHCRQLRSALVWLCLALVCSAQAQTAGFTYQGKLTDGGQPANGTFDLEFKLFDAVSGGAQQGSTLTREDVVVTGGVFTVQLDFGANAFPGAARFLEIGVRPGANTGVFTLLTPRQPVQSTPYALRSLNAVSADALSATCVGCVTGAQIGAGSGNYIQNTTAQQPASDFNISGTGAANILNATTQFNLNNARVLSNAGTANLFAGVGAGAANAGGASNAFVGAGAGANNSTGNLNTFFGRSAGNGNTSGASNSFFGSSAGVANTTGGNNTLVGAGTNVGAGNLDFATALGAGATVAGSNSIVLGRSGGQDVVNVPGALTVTGALTGNGAGLTNLNAGNIAAGTLGTARGGTGLDAAGAAGNYLRSDGTNWTSLPLQSADVPAGSGNYIQNTTSPQAAGNFNISGTGTAGILNAVTQFDLNGQRILTAGALSLFAGLGAGAVTTGGQNTFVGANAGAANTSGNFNAFFGFNAGAAMVTEFNNAFFGARAGESNRGFSNAFFGTDAGRLSTTTSDNTFIGAFAGVNNTTGGTNIFLGRSAGDTNTTGSNNTIIGQRADVGSNNLSNATAIGARAQVTQSDSLVLGSINGVNGATADTKVGIGTTAPATPLQVVGDIRVGTAGTNGCVQRFDATAIAGTCSSDLRFKRNITPFTSLLDKFTQLRPVHYYWRAADFPAKRFGAGQSYGLIAQEVEQVMPELVSVDAEGYKLVDYSKLPLLAVQAIREQQSLIERQRSQLDAQRQELDELKKAFCAERPQAGLCRTPKQ